LASWFGIAQPALTFFSLSESHGFPKISSGVLHAASTVRLDGMNTKKFDSMNVPSFADKRVLFLQGPVGPFFSRLAQDLEFKGAEVFKFNFNAGDWLFFSRNATSFKGDLTAWPEVLKAFIQQNKIDVILLFGDCRPVHACVRGLAQELGCALGVFEEGYLRPDYVTFEPFGVNGHSDFPQSLSNWLMQKALNSDDVRDAETIPQNSTLKVGNTFWHAAGWGMAYFFAAWLGQWFWNNGLHQSWWKRAQERTDQKYFIYENSLKSSGVVSFTMIDHVNSNCAWAFYAAPDAAKGTGSKMEFLALEYVFNVLKLNKIYCEVLDFNTPVINLHKKFGFKEEGVFRAQHKTEMGYSDIYRLGMLALEWNENREAMLARINR